MIKSVDKNAKVSFPFQVAWSDLDANNHMSNSAYLAYAVQSRFAYFNSVGIPPREFELRGVGLAAVSETITYKQELKFLDEFCVDLLCGGINAKRSRFLFANHFIGADRKMYAELQTQIVMFDQRARKALPAPKEIDAAIAALPKTVDFKTLD